jgi:hypothetical protein
MPGIFISYRRDDAAGWAGRLSADLREGLRGAPVFMDIDAIPPGVPWDDYIAQAVGSCDVLIALIGPHWLTVTDKAGRRRLDDPTDLTRLEILAALQRNIRVIPALVGGAEMPAADELPDALKPLARRQAYELADHRWHEDCARLVEVLKPIVGAGTSVGRRLFVGAGILLALLASGYGVKLWLDTPAPRPTPTPTPAPTLAPTLAPTTAPTTEPTTVPTPEPTPEPTTVPTPKPTTVPTPEPTRAPTPIPTAVPTPKPPEPQIALSPPQLAFGSLVVGEKPVPKRFFVRNLTDSPLVLKYGVSGDHRRDFLPTTSDCDPALKGSMTVVKSCYIGFEFSPAEAGRRDAVAVVETLGSRPEVHRLALSGAGLDAEPKPFVKVAAKCATSSAGTYDVEFWGSARGPADATLSVDFHTEEKTSLKVISHSHACGSWRRLSGDRKICARANAPSAELQWRYRGLLQAKGPPVMAMAFVSSEEQPAARAASRIPVTCAPRP